MPKESSPGFTRTPIAIPIDATALAGTGALAVLTDYIPGFKGWVERIEFITRTTLVGASGSQSFDVRAGGAAGTILATCQALIANAAVGVVDRDVVAATLEDDARIASDSDTITVNRKASGTAFSAGSGELIVWVRQREQAAR